MRAEVALQRSALLERHIMTKLSWCIPLLATLIMAPVPAAQKPEAHLGEHHKEHAAHAEHGDEAGHEGHAEGGVALTPEQQQAAGIVVKPLGPRTLAGEVHAPGEVKLNAYATAVIAPRVPAQVVRRHVRLGQHVVKDQPLVTLSSVAMAEAQGALQAAEREWQRAAKLGREVISERRHTEARIARRLAHAKVLAYGMTPAQIEALLREDEAAPADGSFQLLAPRGGTVIRDEFVEGDVVEPGKPLVVISDESTLWVEARLSAEQAVGVRPGTRARVFAHDSWTPGKVIQLHHTLDEATRTLGVRIAIANPGDRLHPGQFVDTRIEGTAQETFLAVPEQAVLRSPDGDWQVYIEVNPGRFRAAEVEVVRRLADLAVIEGLAPGTRIVTQGAFFIQSELAKAGFDIHQH